VLNLEKNDNKRRSKGLGLRKSRRLLKTVRAIIKPKEGIIEGKVLFYYRVFRKTS